MGERTCGNIDGKPCEWFLKMDCERHHMVDRENSQEHERIAWAMDPACHQVLALVEAREEVERLRRIEKAAKAWRERNSVAGRLILDGLGPDGKPVEV